MALPTWSKEEFLAQFDPEVHPRINALLERPDVHGLILFENPNFDSSAFGERTAVIFGPGCTYKSAGEVEGKWLNDLPSQRQYPRAVYVKPVVA